MEKRPFGATGLNVSVLGFGGAPAAFLNPDPKPTADMLNRMLDAGVNVLDTAAMYTGSEKFIGDHLSHRRSEYIIVSKCGSPVPEIHAEPWSRELITQSVDRALRLLKTDFIEVMLLHTCDLATLEKGEALSALVDARKAGKIRFCGYSGDNSALAHAVSLGDIAVVEMSLSLADQANIDFGLAGARKHELGVVAKRPIANAAWKDVSQQQGLYKNYSKQYTQRLEKMNLSPADLGISGPPEKAWPELALRFTLSLDGVSTAVIGTTNPANAAANLAAAEKGRLPDDIVWKIRTAFTTADPEGTWKGLT